MKNKINLFFSLLLVVSMISCTNDSNDIVSSGSNAEINQSQASVESTIALGGGGWGGSIKLRIGRTSKNCGGLGICRVDKIKVNTPITTPGKKAQTLG